MRKKPIKEYLKRKVLNLFPNKLIGFGGGYYCKVGGDLYYKFFFRSESNYSDDPHINNNLKFFTFHKTNSDGTPDFSTNSGLISTQVSNMISKLFLKQFSKSNDTLIVIITYSKDMLGLTRGRLFSIWYNKSGLDDIISKTDIETDSEYVTIYYSKDNSDISKVKLFISDLS